MNGNLMLPIILQIAGMGVMVAEILLPSGGLLSMIAAGMFGYSLYYAFSTISIEVGMLFLIADIILLPIIGLIGLKMLGRSPMALRSSLSKGSGMSSDEALSDLVGREGTAATDLRPSGTVKIGGERIDVVTRGDYINRDETVVVARVEGSRVIVRRKPEEKA